MLFDRYDEILAETTEKLCTPESYSAVSYKGNHEEPMPSPEVLSQIVEQLREVIFPGYFVLSDLRTKSMRYYVGASLDRVSQLLTEQLRRGLCFACESEGACTIDECTDKARFIASRFVSELPEIRRLLATDVQAAYEGDPAARNPGEAIFCYPSILALTNHRLAHVLHKMDVPLIPRIISEKAHSQTGIDVHPGAIVGEYFFMDHGTGIVIGETTVIGDHVRIYQGVTLGAKSFPLDEDGKPAKGIPRHPIVEDEVIIYSGATILGRVVLGRRSVIGGNVWLTRSVAPGDRVVQGRSQVHRFQDGDGI